MDYNATREALQHPEAQATIFGGGGRHNLLPTALCAELSRLAYIRFEHGDAEQAALQQALTLGGLGQVHTFSTRRSGTQGFAVLSSDGQDAYVVFRGTQMDDPTDIGTDLDARLHAWPQGGKVHTGFFNALDSIWDAVRGWLDANPATRLWFTGHSLGAALATLAASRAGRGDARLVTFGSPRVGDHEFAATFQPQQVERYVNCCDVVVFMPPDVGLGYAHIDQQSYIDHAGELHTVPPAADAIERDRVSARMHYLLDQAWRRNNVGVRDLADHSPINYVRAFVD
ncbi:lipase family protein [Rugamonas sp. CCM 8940]|uniref:lipase family protein n=1 Tax=Rugamonas sp. CCM 8940 TaxID=2765359 RepID=UPI0018F711F8|nr:lipase family protein [Rugamonas sp. CCM 8940]MBJ7308872.1 lipase family protein [Rugamonas sp. CCM 8940]